MRKKLTLFLLLASNLIGAHVQPDTTPEFEEQILLTCSQKTSAPLSETLELLIRGISDRLFDKKFFDKIAKLEAQKYTGEFLDHWENGTPKIKATFKNGKVDGHVHGWYPEGQEAFKAFFYENTKAGIHMAFYDDNFPPEQCDGHHARLISYDYDGRLDGKQLTRQNKPLRLKTLSNYKYGVLDGSRVKYNMDGVCIQDEFYENGKIVPGKTTEHKRR